MNFIKPEVLKLFMAIGSVMVVCVVIALGALVLQLMRNKSEQPLKFTQFTLRQFAFLIVVVAILFALLRL